MNATNPFQIPSCFQVDYERRRCERFKRTFMGVVAVGTLLMVALLIEGSMSERAKAASTTSLPASLPEPQPITAASTEVKPVSIPQPTPPPALSQSATAVSKVNTAPAGSAAVIYTVKTGDSLLRIARAHGTTVKAVKAANGLADDHIAAGMKLKMPQA